MLCVGDVCAYCTNEVQGGMKERLVLPLDSSMQCLSDAWRGQECVWYCADVTDMTDSVRASCARVVDAASHVTIDAERLESFAQSLVCGGRGRGRWKSHMIALPCIYCRRM